MSKILLLKDIRKYLVIWIINNNVATEITRLQKKYGSTRESSLLLEFYSVPLGIQPTLPGSEVPPWAFEIYAPKPYFFPAPSRFLPGGAFCVSHVCYYLFLLSRMQLTKCPPSILMYSCDHTNCPGLSILFLYAPAHKTWIYEKFVFELEAFLCDFKIDCSLL